MKNCKIVTVIIITSFLFISCTYVSFAPSRSQYRPSRTYASEDVQVYRSEKPNRHYKEIGSIHVFGVGTLESKVNKMKLEAAHNGGNGIVDVKVTSDGVVGTLIISDD